MQLALLPPRHCHSTVCVVHMHVCVSWLSCDHSFPLTTGMDDDSSIAFLCLEPHIIIITCTQLILYSYALICQHCINDSNIIKFSKVLILFYIIIILWRLHHVQRNGKCYSTHRKNNIIVTVVVANNCFMWYLHDTSWCDICTHNKHVPTVTFNWQCMCTCTWTKSLSHFLKKKGC